MAAEFALPLTAEGAVTAPTGVFSFVEPMAETQTFLDVGPANVLEIDEFGWAIADGVNPLRLVTRGGVYDAGGLAPGVAPTVAGTGAQATSRLDTDQGGAYAIANDDYIQLVSLGSRIYFKTTLDASPIFDEVAINGSTANALINLKKLINDTGIEGTDYRRVTPWETYITSTTITTTDLTFKAVQFGTSGNAFHSVWVGGVGPRFEIDGSDTAQVLFSGGTVGTGSAPGAGTYRYFYTWYRDADGAETGRSPVASVAQYTAQNIAISVLAASADTTFDYIRVYRTATLGVEFYLVGSVPRATSTLTDDVLDAALVVSHQWNELLHRSYSEGVPPRGRALALWKGRMWTLGAHIAAEYTRGTVSVTADSATVTFSIKGVAALMAGRTFQVSATSEEYTILSVSEAGPTAVLDRVYEGTTNGTASFTIMDDYDAARIRGSVEFLWNQWPVDESPGRVDTDSVEGGTALLATKSRLFAFSPTSIVAVTGSGPDSWELSKIGQGVGCAAPRLVVGIDDGGGIVSGGAFLGKAGFYAISDDGSMVHISSPKARRGSVARGLDGTVARISWANIDQGYSYYDTVNRTLVFGVPLDGAVTPNYEIVFDLQNGTWTTFKRAEWTAATSATLPAGGAFILAGDRTGNLWHEGIGESDGFYGAEAVATLTGAQTVRVLTASGASWSTSGDSEKGKPVIVLYANGTTVAYGKVASNTGTAITLESDLATAPAASDQVVLGGIAWQAKSGFTTFGEEWRVKGMRSVIIRHAPSTRGDYYLSFAVDGGTFALCPVGTSIGALTEADGKVRHFTQWPGDTHAINLRGFKPGGRAILRGGVFDVNVRENGRI